MITSLSEGHMHSFFLCKISKFEGMMVANVMPNCIYHAR